MHEVTMGANHGAEPSQRCDINFCLPSVVYELLGVHGKRIGGQRPFQACVILPLHVYHFSSYS